MRALVLSYGGRAPICSEVAWNGSGSDAQVRYTSPMQPLPIDLHLPRLLERLRADGAAVLVAPPGAGKSTRVPGGVTSVSRPAAESVNRVLAPVDSAVAESRKAWHSPLSMALRSSCRGNSRITNRARGVASASAKAPSVKAERASALKTP